MKRPRSVAGRTADLIIMLLVVALLVWKPEKPVHAAPSGALTTTEITISAGVVIYFLKYDSVLKRIKGSYDQAEATITDMDIVSFAYLALPADDCRDGMMVDYGQAFNRLIMSWRLVCYGSISKQRLYSAVETRVRWITTRG